MKPNPSKQDLIEFVNQVTAEQSSSIKKIQDLSTGIHYLLILNNVFPNIVKTSKINFKAFHQYESINNLKLLAIYLSQIVAPFTVQITKISQKNYQDNLNLLKNMHKFYYENKSKNQNQKVIQKQKVLTRSTTIIGKQSNVSSKQKMILKAGNILQKHQMKKIGPTNQGLKGVIKTQQNLNQQIKKILEIVQDKKTPQQEAAQIKLNKIKKILGLQVPTSHKKSKIKNQQQQINFSIKCTGSKSQKQLNYQFQVPEQKKKQIDSVIKSEEKQSITNKNSEPIHQTDLKNMPKKFNCQQIKQTMVKNYQLRQTPSRKNAENRRSRQNIDNWLKQQDTRQYQNLLSPLVDNEIYKESNSKRKSILKMNQNISLQLSKQKINSSENKINNRKSVRFSPVRTITERKSQLSSSKKASQSKKQNIQILQIRKSPRS